MSDLDIDAFERACRATFQEYEGLLLSDGAWTPETLSAWKAQLKDDASAIESVVNHMHMRQVFFDAEDYLAEEVATAASRIQACWIQTLARMLPRQSFEVELLQPTGDEVDIGEFQLTVRRRRGAD